MIECYYMVYGALRLVENGMLSALRSPLASRQAGLVSLAWPQFLSRACQILETWHVPARQTHRFDCAQKISLQCILVFVSPPSYCTGATVQVLLLLP